MQRIISRAVWFGRITRRSRKIYRMDLDSRDGAGGSGRDGWDGAGPCGAKRALTPLTAVFGPAVPRKWNPVAFSLIRKTGLPHCCGWKGLGGAERSEAAREGRPGRCGAAGHARLAWRDGEGQQRRGRVVRVGGWVGGQTWAWAWMGRAGNAQGKAQQQGRLNPLPAATAFWWEPAGRRRVGSRRSSHGGRKFAIAEIAIY